MCNPTIFRIGAGAAVLCLALCPGLAEENQVSPQRVVGPVLGFVHDQTAGIRPILGIPGATTLGHSVLPGAGYDSVVFAPQRDYALALTAGERRLALLNNLRASPTVNVIEIESGAGRIAFSPTGDSAAVHYGEARRVAVITGLPVSPRVSWELYLPDLPGGLKAIAVSDGGSAVLAAGEGEQGPIFLLAPDVGYRRLPTVAGSPIMAFLVNRLDAVVADGESSSVFLVRDVKGEARMTQIAGQAEGVPRAVAVAAAADNRAVFIAYAEPAGVLRLSLTGEAPVAIPCSCAPKGLERLAGNATFRLNDPGQGPVWLLDGDGSPARILFVPNQARPRYAERLRVPVPVRGGGER